MFESLRYFRAPLILREINHQVRFLTVDSRAKGNATAADLRRHHFSTTCVASSLFLASRPLSSQRGLLGFVRILRRKMRARCAHVCSSDQRERLGAWNFPHRSTFHAIASRAKPLLGVLRVHCRFDIIMPTSKSWLARWSRKDDFVAKDDCERTR